MRAVQFYSGGVVDGVVGNDTWYNMNNLVKQIDEYNRQGNTVAAENLRNALNECYKEIYAEKSVLSRGMNNDSVKVLQQKLNYLGLYTAGIDGRFEEQTWISVRALQRACGIYEDGVVGTSTWDAILDQIEIKKTNGDYTYNNNQGSWIQSCRTQVVQEIEAEKQQNNNYSNQTTLREFDPTQVLPYIDTSKYSDYVKERYKIPLRIWYDAEAGYDYELIDENIKRDIQKFAHDYCNALKAYGDQENLHPIATDLGKAQVIFEKFLIVNFSMSQPITASGWRESECLWVNQEVGLYVTIQRNGSYKYSVDSLNQFVTPVTELSTIEKQAVLANLGIFATSITGALTSEMSFFRSPYGQKYNVPSGISSNLSKGFNNLRNCELDAISNLSRQGYSVEFVQQNSGLITEVKVNGIVQRMSDLVCNNYGFAKLLNRSMAVTNWEEIISRMSSNDRVATVTQKTIEIARNFGWEKNNNVSIRNNRIVYKDIKTNNYYSVDTQHGRFEQCNSKGKHLGEFDIELNQTKPADISGKHDLKIN